MADDPEIITDNDNPEWTEADFARAKPFKDMFPSIRRVETWTRSTESRGSEKAV